MSGFKAALGNLIIRMFTGHHSPLQVSSLALQQSSKLV